MLRIVKAAVTLAAVVGVYQVAAIANGTGLPPPSSSTPAAAPARPMTPEEMAVGVPTTAVSSIAKKRSRLRKRRSHPRRTRIARRKRKRRAKSTRRRSRTSRRPPT